MARISVCTACEMEKQGVKSRIAFPHTCGKLTMREEMEKPEKPIQHNWIEGRWKADRWVWTREDKCSLCGCVRGMVKGNVKGRVFADVSYYERSTQIFSAENMPQCWGGPGPV